MGEKEDVYAMMARMYAGHSWCGQVHAHWPFKRASLDAMWGR